MSDGVYNSQRHGLPLSHSTPPRTWSLIYKVDYTVNRIERPLTGLNRDIKSVGPFGESESFDPVNQWKRHRVYTV